MPLVEAISQHMERMVEACRRFVADAAHQFRTPLAACRQIDLGLVAAANAPVTVSRQSVANLIDNAIRYPPEGSELMVGVAQ